MLIEQAFNPGSNPVDQDALENLDQQLGLEDVDLDQFIGTEELKPEDEPKIENVSEK